MKGDQQIILESLNRGKRVEALVYSDGRMTHVQISKWYYPVLANSLKALLRAGKVKMLEKESKRDPEWIRFELA